MAVCYRQMSKTGTTDLTTAEVQGIVAEDSEPELDGGFGLMRRTVSSRCDEQMPVWVRGGREARILN